MPGNFVATDHKDVFNGSIAPGATQLIPVNVDGYSFLSTWINLQATTTTGDLTVTYGCARADGITFTQIMPTVRTVGPASDGTNVNRFDQLDVRGMKVIQISVKNNNVGAKSSLVTVMLGTGSV